MGSSPESRSYHAQFAKREQIVNKSSGEQGGASRKGGCKHGAFDEGGALERSETVEIPANRNAFAAPLCCRTPFRDTPQKSTTVCESYACMMINTKNSNHNNNNNNSNHNNNNNSNHNNNNNNSSKKRKKKK